MMIAITLLLISFYCFGSNNVLLAANIPASASAGRSWKATPSLSDLDGASWVNGGNITAQLLLSTTAGCSSGLKPNYSFSVPQFGFGFIGEGIHDFHPSFLGIFVGADLYAYGSVSDPRHRPVVVWTAAVDSPIDKDAALDFAADGNLVLKDGSGRQVWSTQATTSGLSAKSMDLTCEGNLILLDDKRRVVWQSFDHPTDTWLPGQKLHLGQRLTSKQVTDSNHNFAQKVYASLAEDGLHAFVDTDPPTQYSFSPWHDDGSKQNHSFEFVQLFSSLNMSNFTYLRLEPQGNLNLFQYTFGNEISVWDVFTLNLVKCKYPTRCRSYGICFSDDSCSCPRDDDDRYSNSFQPVDPYNSDLGCKPVTPLSCPDTHKLQNFTRLESVTYFGFKSFLRLTEVDVERCKRACLENCSCAAAIFHYRKNVSSGNCSLPSQLLTLMHIDNPNSLGWGYNSTTFIKVQRNLETGKRKSLVSKLVPSVSVSILVLIFFGAGAWYYTSVRRRKTDEGTSDVAIETATRFSFETLRVATQDFQKRLGRGGFGSVFEGTLEDGKSVAVKRLDSVGQGRREFLAEVTTIGTLHHYNLVKLIGFCEEGLHRLLVYEYMQNGSLDNWIFNQDLAHTLTWSLRQKIISGIAKGLEYLHENCNQNVIHFDIKPQNILLDADFNVKISDFGLAKMVDRDEAQVLTKVRGTPGYIAPELISGRAISVKVDVYSFGVLALEIVCGRKNVGAPYEECLINLVKLKADEDHLIDLVDMRTEDMQQNAEEAVKMMKIGIWCLQPHFIRPTMSIVVKVLQDLPNMETLTDLSYLTIGSEAIPTGANMSVSTRPSESLLSGPR